MKKIQIKLISIGHLPGDLTFNKINQWQSELFELTESIDHYGLRVNSDGDQWEYSDQNISTQLPSLEKENFLIALVGVPLENNWYTRRVAENKIVFTFHEISNYLRLNNIPLENVILRLLYAYTLVYIRNGNRVPSVHEIMNFTHDETRGCIFDMNGLKEDIVYSCDKPIICPACTEQLIIEKVSETSIEQAKFELLKVKKILYFRLVNWIKSHPIYAILISSVWAILLGLIGSLIGKLFE